MRRFVLRLLGLSALAAMAASLLGAAAMKARGDHGTVADFDPSDDEIDVGAIFEGFELASRARAFRGGEMVLWYGGGVLDLRGATLDPDGARLSVRSVFGGMQLVVPATWAIRVHSLGLFGGVGSEGRDAPAEGPALVIDALSVFGGIGITTRGPKDDEATASEPARQAAPEASAPSAPDPDTAGA